MELSARLQALDDLLRGFPDLVVAFSGGVDSSVLLHASARALGTGLVALIGDSPSLPRRELDEARAFAAEIGVRLETLATDELADEEYRRNDGARCYRCRQTLFSAMETWARARGFAALAYGEITDDLLDERPGRRAAAELGVRAPLREAGLSKADVRAYARLYGLALAEKPAAACLASRLPLGTAVTRAALARVEAAEESLRDFDLGLLRVRDHGARARVEVDAGALARARGLAAAIAARLRPLGFEELTLAAYHAAASPAKPPA